MDPRDPRKRAQVERPQNAENGPNGSNGQSTSGAVYEQYQHGHPGFGNQPVQGQYPVAHEAPPPGNTEVVAVNGVPPEQVRNRPPPPPPGPLVHAERRAMVSDNVERKSQYNGSAAVNAPVHEEHHVALMHGSDYSVCEEAKTQSIERGPHTQLTRGVAGVPAVSGQREAVRTEEEEKAQRRAMDIRSLSISLEKELERGRQMLTNMKQPNDKNGQKEYIHVLRRQIECLKKSNLEMWKYQNQRNKMQMAAGNSRFGEEQKANV